jgi:cobalt-precorrin 5A hydrolase / precorrin-3B C17-methyltransferase
VLEDDLLFMLDFPMTAAIVILGQTSLPVARRLQTVLPHAQIYGLASRTVGVDIEFTNFGETVRDLFSHGVPIIGICAAGILIRTIAPLLTDKWQEPPVLAIAEDGSAVVPLLGGLQGVNDLARQCSDVLHVSAAITTTGDIRFRTALLSPPPGYQLVNPEVAKTFLADLLAGQSVRIVGDAPWLIASRLPIAADGALTIQVVETMAEYISGEIPPNQLVYCKTSLPEPEIAIGTLFIVGTGPGSADWISPQVQQVLQRCTEWVGYKTYLDLAEPWRSTQTRHESDNRVECDRARAALNLAALGKSVAVISSGDPGIYAMAAAVFEVLEQEARPEWQAIEVQVCPGISAMQAAAAQVGAPLGHDFCTISLSDILKPWDVIAQRILKAAEADFAIAFYNPVSQNRTWQLDQARDLLLQVRSPETPVVLARNVGRPGQQVTVKPLGELQGCDADMRTVVLVGSSKTRMFQQSSTRSWIYTPRTYESNK